ncbi:MAG: NACHT domain-containing NTPase, partial [Spirulina sp.]
MFMIDYIISELVSAGLNKVKNRVSRNLQVIKLLKKFNLKPNEPPKDFEGVYVYTLIEYGVGKPQAILKLFARKEIKDAFSQAFKANNPHLLLQKVEKYIESKALGNKISTQGIDYRRELAEFSAMFIEVAKRIRTPANVLLAHQITNLQASLAAVRSQLQQINSLPEMRSQLQQLVQSYQKLLPPVAPKQETELGRELREWFITLGYRFESYEAIEEEYFEWIINIPARRGYDRILVRGVDGEAGINDINEVREVVATNKTDEGWIVAPRRVSRAARNEVKKEENCSIFCYTFDELLDDVADFSGYFDWLENEVKSRKVDETYVPLACTKEEVDPDTHQRIGVSHYEEQDGWIDGYIDMWLDDPAKKHISILGEFGTGKTWFALHYAWTALNKYLEAKEQGIKRPRLPLVIPLRDYAKAVTVESLFSEFFFRKHEIGLPGYSAFEKLNRMGKLLLIFDGFDEMAARVDRQAMVNNFWELAKVVVPGAKAILTCR